MYSVSVALAWCFLSICMYKSTLSSTLYRWPWMNCYDSEAFICSHFYITFNDSLYFIQMACQLYQNHLPSMILIIMFLLFHSKSLFVLFISFHSKRKIFHSKSSKLCSHLFTNQITEMLSCLTTRISRAKNAQITKNRITISFR